MKGFATSFDSSSSPGRTKCYELQLRMRFSLICQDNRNGQTHLNKDGNDYSEVKYVTKRQVESACKIFTLFISSFTNGEKNYECVIVEKKMCCQMQDCLSDIKVM